MKKNIVPKLYLLISLILAMFMFALYGCGGGDGGSPASPLAKVAKIIGNTTFTDEVVTDGTWLAWEGRQQKLMFNNGTSNIDLGAKLDPKYSLGTDNDSWRGMKFDGRYLVFIADDVTDSKPPQVFMVDTQSTTYTPVQLSDITDAAKVDYSSARLDNGVLAWLMDSTTVAGQKEVFYYNTHATTPAVTQLTSSPVTKSQLTVSGNIIAWVNDTDSEVYAADISVSPVITTALTSTAVPKSSLQGKAGLLAWYEGFAVYYSNGTVVGTKQATADGNGNAISNLTVGNGNVAWHQGSSIVYRASADAEKTVHIAATGIGSTNNDLSIGDGIIAWSRQTDSPSSYYQEGYVYTMGAAADTASTFTTMASYPYQHPFAVKVAGKKIFWVQDMKSTGSSYPSDENPSCYLWVYDSAVASPVAAKVSTNDYFRILTTASADGKAAWYGHDSNRRIYVTNADNIGAPVAATPASVNAMQPQISNGILVYKGMDRDNMLGAADGDDQEIFYCKLNTAGWPITRVTSNLTEDDKPSISGNIIAWKNNDTDAVSFYNIVTAATTTMTSTSDDAIRTDGRFVIWRNTSNQLYYYDTKATTPVETAVTGATSLSKCPNISNGLLTWITTSKEVYYMDLKVASSTPVLVATALDSNQAPQTDGRFIVWGGSYKGNYDYSIWYYDTTATTPAAIELAADYMREVCIPRLSNGRIVFAAINYSDTDTTDTNREIYTVNLTATTPTVIQLTDNGLWNSNPDVVNGVVIWRIGGSKQFEWYGKIAAAIRL